VTNNGHSHRRHRGGAHGHTHGAVDPRLTTTERGIWALKWSFIGLLATAVFQLVIVYFSGSVALLADSIHNFGDMATAVPLWIAFTVARRKPSYRFTYGLGRVEDVAGVIIVLIILFSAIAASYQSIHRLLSPQPIEHLWVVALAAIVGFAGNEIAAIFRIRVGKEINSAALIADGYHARADGLVSLGVLVSVVGVWLGYALADPIVGLIMTVAILRIVWESSKAVFLRLLDGVDPKVIDEIKEAAGQARGVRGVSEVRVRWSGHWLHAEVNLTVSPELSVAEAHAIAWETRHQLLHHLPYISIMTIHVDSEDAAGEEHHRVAEHAHGDLPNHSHP
jgi:cation diffusion facilitator family transporter